MSIFFMFIKPSGYSQKSRPHIPIKGLRLGHLLGTGKPSISYLVSSATHPKERVSQCSSDLAAFTRWRGQPL